MVRRNEVLCFMFKADGMALIKQKGFSFHLPAQSAIG